jgi:hypothetical protein
MNRILGVFFCLLALAALAPPAQCCKCVVEGPTPVKEALAQAKAVFVGRVVESHLINEEYVLFVFAVDRSWKGAREQRVTLRTGRNEGICGFPFMTGEDYVVYAFGQVNERDPTLETNICTRTHRLQRDDPDLAELGKPEVVFAGEANAAPEKKATTTFGGAFRSSWVMIVTAAVGVAFVLGVTVGVLVGRRRRRQPLDSKPASVSPETGITSKLPGQ